MRVVDQSAKLNWGWADLHKVRPIERGNILSHHENIQSATDQVVDKYVEQTVADATSSLQSQLSQSEFDNEALQDQLEQRSSEVSSLTQERNTLVSRVAALEQKVRDLTSGTPTTPSPAPTTGNPLPDLPTYKYTDLYRSGDDLAAVVDRLPGRGVLLLPDGDFEWSDFTRGSGYGIYHPNFLGFGGNGRNRTRLRMKQKSSTKASQVPAQSAGGTNQLNLMRVGEGFRQTTMFGMTIDGTDQGHLYNGLSVYKATNAVWEDLLLRGVNPGDWSSPPGETFGVNSFRTVGFTMRNVEIDGRRADGTRVGGSPYGGNCSDGDYLEDCYFHDSEVSSVTWSFAGSPTNPDSPSRNVKTLRLKVERNANHKMASGKRFTGFNHENVQGTVLHEYPTIILDPTANSEWLTSHMTFVNVLSDNPNITIKEPTWEGGSPLNRGCFVINSPKAFMSGQYQSKQVTAPKVIKNGVQLEPYVLPAYSSSPLPVDPARHYVWIRA